MSSSSAAATLLRAFLAPAGRRTTTKVTFNTTTWLVRPFTSTRLVGKEQKKAVDNNNNNNKPKQPLGIPYTQLKVGIPKETLPLEKRVAATPESVQRLIQPGLTVLVEQNAGEGAYFDNASYEQAGAKVVDNVWNEADIVLKVSC